MGKILVLVMAVATIWLLGVEKVDAASAVGTAKQVVVSALSIANVSDLDFGSAAQGDTAKTVAPGTAEDSFNGSFNVNGEANTPYTISLPADGAVTMIKGAGGANQTIAVSGFTSAPGATGLLNGSGFELLLVGATRAALGAAQEAGSYTATYTVTVVY